MAEKDTVLIVEDDERFCSYHQEMLMEQKYNLETAMNLKIAEAKLRNSTPDVVLLDLRFPPRNKPEEGLAFLEKIRSFDPFIKVIIVTGVRDRSIALKAVDLGAYDFVGKDTSSCTELPFRVKQALEKRRLERELMHTKQKEIDLHKGYPCGPGQYIIGISEKMKAIYELISRFAQTSGNVLITGETGSGKELIAQAIYYHSTRNKAPFIPIDCSSLSNVTSDLVVSELFGVIANYPGFHNQTALPGKFELADKGMLFLDEIGDIPLSVQPQLLRVLQGEGDQREIRPLGGEKPIQVDVRVIAATNRDLKQAIQDEKFRQALYERFWLRIRVPPLRERVEDIPLLVEYFFAKYRKENPSIISFQENIIPILRKHDWPGNVRQLERVIYNAIILASGNSISAAEIEQIIERGDIRPKIATTEKFDEANLPDDFDYFRKYFNRHGEVFPNPEDVSLSWSEMLKVSANLGKRLQAIYRMIYMQSILERTGGNQTKAAESVGISRENFLGILREARKNLDSYGFCLSESD